MEPCKFTCGLFAELDTDRPFIRIWPRGANLRDGLIFQLHGLSNCRDDNVDDLTEEFYEICDHLDKLKFKGFIEEDASKKGYPLD